MKHQSYTIGCIGLGNMGGAILSGLSKVSSKENLFGYDKDSEKVSLFSSKITAADSASALVEKSDAVILAVKPDIIPALLSEIKSSIGNTLIISIAAGTTIESIESAAGKDKKSSERCPTPPRWSAKA